MNLRSFALGATLFSGLAWGSMDAINPAWSDSHDIKGWEKSWHGDESMTLANVAQSSVEMGRGIDLNCVKIGTDHFMCVESEGVVHYRANSDTESSVKCERRKEGDWGPICCESSGQNRTCFTEELMEGMVDLYKLEYQDEKDKASNKKESEEIPCGEFARRTIIAQEDDLSVRLLSDFMIKSICEQNNLLREMRDLLKEKGK